MNKTILNQYIPDYVSPPGETLLETLEELGMSQEDLAERIGIPKGTINEIIPGKAAITNELALQLEQVLGISASFWNNREQNYRDALARQSEVRRMNFYKSERSSKSMTHPSKKLNPKPEQKALEAPKVAQAQPQTQTDISPDQRMLQTIRSLKNGLRDYEIRTLVEQAENLGSDLKQRELKTNQIRKFLDAVNRLKVNLAQDKEQRFSTIKDEVFLLKPKLAYAAARQQDGRGGNPVKPLSDVISEAINKVEDSPDFYRLVQLIESIIAYHKAAGGKD